MLIYAAAVCKRKAQRNPGVLFACVVLNDDLNLTGQQTGISSAATSQVLLMMPVVHINRGRVELIRMFPSGTHSSFIWRGFCDDQSSQNAFSNVPRLSGNTGVLVGCLLKISHYISCYDLLARQ